MVALAAMLGLSACAHHPKRHAPAPRVERHHAARAPTVTAQARTPHAPPESGDQIMDGGPPVPPDVSRVPEPVPRVEPLAAYGNKSPYTVLGKTYSVLPSSRGFVQRGIASWYGTKFHGRLTSSREPYDMYQLTAAHKTLPLPTFARVTNLENGRSIVVRINDRGPFHQDRIIDLSYAAAIKLGIHAKGTGRVEVRAIDPGRPGSDRLPTAPIAAEPASTPRAPAASSPASPAPSTSASSRSVFLQVGAFNERDNASRVARRLREADIKNVFLDQTLRGIHLIHRVRIGPVRGQDRIEALRARLRDLGFGSISITEE